MRYLILLFFILTMSFAVNMQSSSKQATLLELFTSEGCNSCPPADKWINKFAKDDKLFKEIIPVVFHVDYWDRLGWIDKFAKYKYSNAWKTSSVYTPGLVLNGKEFRNWRSYKSKLQFSNKYVGVLKATVKNNKVNINFNSKIYKNKKVNIEVSIFFLFLVLYK